MRVNLSGLSIEIQNCCCIITLFHWEISLLSKIDAHMLEHFAIRTERMGEVPLSTLNNSHKPQPQRPTQTHTPLQDFVLISFCLSLVQYEIIFHSRSREKYFMYFSVYEDISEYLSLEIQY